MRSILPAFSKFKPLYLFTKELIRDPRAVGAACPSSPYLANKIAQQVSLPLNGNVLELGAGTGVITSALIEQGLAEEQLIVVERSEALAKHLIKRFPNVNVISDDAQFIEKHITGKSIDYVVSSLPLRSLPKPVVQKILASCEAAMNPTSKFIQFTYSWRADDSLMFKNMKRLYSKYVWFNVPPARIDIYGRDE